MQHYEQQVSSGHSGNMWVNVLASQWPKNQAFGGIYSPVAWLIALQICSACDCGVLLYWL